MCVEVADVECGGEWVEFKVEEGEATRRVFNVVVDVGDEEAVFAHYDLQDEEGGVGH